MIHRIAVTGLALVLAACTAEKPADPADLSTETEPQGATVTTESAPSPEEIAVIGTAGDDWTCPTGTTTPPAMDVAPASFRTGPAAELSFEIDAAIAAFDPRLANALNREGEQVMTDFLASAEKDRAEPGNENMPGYTLEFGWGVAAQSGDMISLELAVWQYLGGAHGLGEVNTLLYDRASGTYFSPGQVFTDATAADEELTRAAEIALTAAKRERLGEDMAEDMLIEPVTLALEEGVLFSLPVGLAPSANGTQFGGFTIQFNPYIAGSYAEGAYEVTIPAKVLQAYIAPACLDAFDFDS